MGVIMEKSKIVTISLISISLAVGIISCGFIKNAPLYTYANYEDTDPCSLPSGYSELDTYLAGNIPTSSNTALSVKTRGTITNVVSDGSHQYGYMQRTNPTTRIESSIYLYRMPNNPILEVGDVIDVEAKMYSYYGLNEITTTYTHFSKLSVANPNPAIPYELTEDNVATFMTQQNVSRLVKASNLEIKSVGSTVTNNSYNIKATATLGGSNVNIMLFSYNSSKTNELVNAFTTAMNSNSCINIKRANLCYSYNVVYVHVMSINDIEIGEGEIEKPEEDTTYKTLDLYAINDFHGAIEATSSLPGIEAIGGYLKNKIVTDENTLLLNSGDLWQGNIESNYNYGKMLTEVCNEIGFSAFAIGNHEFDWGDSYIKSNAQVSSNMKFLGANIYNYQNGVATTRATDLCDDYVIKTMPNGLKVGVIGVIGKDQITSILSPNVAHLTFVDPSEVVKNLSQELRNEKDCDVVVLSAHTDQQSLLQASDYYNDYSKITSYVDAIFCAHTHDDEVYLVNGVPVIQALGDGKQISNIKLKVSDDGDVSLLNHANISSSTYSSYKDEEVREIINSYTVDNAEFMAAKNKVLGKVVGSFNYQHQLANLAARAAYEYAKDKYDFDYVVVNSQRTTLSATNSLTYGTLFTSIPFENKVVLAEVTGSSLKKELGYDSISMYRVDNEPFDQNKNYKILCVDYTLYHMNANRQYNYFPGHVDLGNVKLNGEDYYLRDMVADYILDVGTITNTNFSDTLDRHNTSIITSRLS